MTQVRSLLTDRVCKADIKIKANLMGNGRKMQHRVGGAAQCHIHSQCIHDGFLCDDVAGTDILIVHIHNCHTGMLCKLDALRIHSRDRTVSSKSHAQRLCQTVHGVGGVHTGAGTAGRADLVLKLRHIILCHCACRIGTNSLEHGRQTSLLSLYVSGQHRASGYKNSRQIQSGCSHQKTRNILVTVWNHNQCVKLMCNRHTLGRICN